jgi:lipopolysaccharide export system permease protein
LGFKEYKKILDLSSFKMSKTADSAFKDNYKMLSVRQLNKTIDSLGDYDKYFESRTKNEVSPYLAFVRYADTGWTKVNPKNIRAVKSFDQVLPDSAKASVLDHAINQINAAKPMVDLIATEYENKKRDVDYFRIEWHRKFTLSVACIVLFLIGAPLGSIIRKGGLGTPLVFAVIFFVIFHLFNTFGEKLAKTGSMSPFEGMWLSTAVLIPIGFFLTYKAMRDSQLFNHEYYYRSLKKLQTFLGTFRKEKKS